MPAAPHHTGTFHVQSRKIREAAYDDPNTPCWRCQRTLAQHPPHRNGTPASWHAGHAQDGQVEGALLPEASTCNQQAARGNTTPTATTRHW